MKLSSALLQNVLFASAVLATPKGYGLASRVERRAARHLPHPILAEGIAPATPDRTTPALASITVVTGTAAPVAGDGGPQNTGNWAGAIIGSPPSGETFNNVVGTFTIPTPSTPPGPSGGSYYASVFVGIDGGTYKNASLQSGIDFTYENGAVSYDAWYQWYPSDLYHFSGISLSASNVITVTIEASSLSSGTVTINNQSTGEKVSESLTAPNSESLTAPNSSSELAGQSAEWIVEDPTVGTSPNAFADFGTVTFTGCSASTASTTENLDNAIALNIERVGQPLTSVSNKSSSGITITYV